MNEINKAKALTAWQEHLDAWKQADIDLRNLPDSIQRSELAEPLKAWWSAASDLLLASVHLEVHFGCKPEPSPFELQTKLSIMAADLANGNIPALVSCVVSRGRPKTWDAERRDIGKAVRYVQAVKRGEIKDKAPNKTIREAFSVSSATVRQWVRDADFFTYRLPASKIAAERITREMKEAGKRYQRAGRSAQSILHRNAKRGES